MTTEVHGLSTGLSTNETSSGPEVTGGRSPRAKTSHLKEVPETLELRESLRARCEQIAGRLDRSVPMTKDEMEQIARAAFEEADLSEGYLGWMMVMISSAFWKQPLRRSLRATIVLASPLPQTRRRLSGRL